MFKLTYLEGNFIKEKEITFSEAISEIESYFIIMDGTVKDINVKIEIPAFKGVGASFNNHIKIDSLYNCFKRFNDSIILEFKEFTQSIAINEKANVTIDFKFNRIFIDDYNMSIYFNK